MIYYLPKEEAHKMGFFKSIKKAFKKIIKGVKKVVKKVVKGVKKVVKKIGSSKILKALAIAAAIVVTGGAALTAFGGTGTLASSTFGQWMMTTSQSILGGSAFGTGATTGIGKFIQGAGNFAAKTLAKPFGAVEGAIGSTARVGANIVQGKDLLAAGPGVGGVATTPGAILTAPTPFSAEAFSGQIAVADTVSYDPTANAGKGGYINTDPTTKVATPLTQAEVDSLPHSYTSQVDKVTGKSKSSSSLNVGEQITAGAIGMGFGLTERAIAGRYLSEDPRGTSDSLFVEGKSPLDPIRVYAAENNINFADIYSNPTYGTGDPSYMMNSALFSQATIGSPTSTGATV